MATYTYKEALADKELRAAFICTHMEMDLGTSGEEQAWNEFATREAYMKFAAGYEPAVVAPVETPAPVVPAATPAPVAAPAPKLKADNRTMAEKMTLPEDHTQKALAAEIARKEGLVKTGTAPVFEGRTMTVAKPGTPSSPATHNIGLKGRPFPPHKPTNTNQT